MWQAISMFLVEHLCRHPNGMQLQNIKLLHRHLYYLISLFGGNKSKNNNMRTQSAFYLTNSLLHSFPFCRSSWKRRGVHSFYICWKTSPTCLVGNLSLEAQQLVTQNLNSSYRAHIPNLYLFNICFDNKVPFLWSGILVNFC